MNKLQFTLPFLRFKEFSDDYIFIKLDQISELQKNGSLSKTDIHNEGKFKCILYGELFTTYDSIIKSESILSKTNKKSKLLTNSNCIVFPSSSTTLVDFFPCSSIKTSGVMLGQDINCFFVNDNNSSDYLSYFFSKKSNKIKIFRLTEGSTINHLYGNYLKSFTMCISNNIKEQIKISKFFSLLDKHIELWERKLQLYLLFFNYYHKYFFNLKITEMDCKINDYYCIPLKKAIDKNKYINYKKMILKLNNQGYELTNDSPIATEKGRSYFVREKNELLIGKQNIHNSSFYVLDDIGDKFVTSNALMSLISKEDISTKYLYYFMKQKRWLYYVDSLNLSTGQKEYSEKQILNLPFKIINSHKKIVNFLEHIEKEISFIKTKISFLKNKKEFFLNKLFV